jgi:hypothetical protein
MVLTGLIDSYTDFQTKYTQYGNNYEVVPVLNNVNFGYGRNQSIKIGANFFGVNLMRTHSGIINKLCWKDCTVNPFDPRKKKFSDRAENFISSWP